jgi:hypothetical protein
MRRAGHVGTRPLNCGVMRQRHAIKFPFTAAVLRSSRWLVTAVHVGMLGCDRLGWCPAEYPGFSAPPDGSYRLRVRRDSRSYRLGAHQGANGGVGSGRRAAGGKDQGFVGSVNGPDRPLTSGNPRPRRGRRTNRRRRNVTDERVARTNQGSVVPAASQAVGADRPTASLDTWSRGRSTAALGDCACGRASSGRSVWFW